MSDREFRLLMGLVVLASLYFAAHLVYAVLRAWS